MIDYETEYEHQPMIPKWVEKLDYPLRKKWESNTLSGVLRVVIRYKENANIDRILQYRVGEEMTQGSSDIRFIACGIELETIEKLASLPYVTFISEEAVFHCWV
jgi:hypothetical protein